MSVLALIMSTQKILRIPIRDKRKIVIAYTLVRDDQFGRVLAELRWYLNNSGYPITTRRQPNGKVKAIVLHHVVYEHYHGHVPKGLLRDHRDRNQLNNVPTNLRAVTPSTNRANSRRRIDNTSGYTGVVWCKHTNKWTARLNARYQGYHTCKHAGARAVNQAYGEHFPDVDIPNPEAETLHLDTSECNESCRFPITIANPNTGHS